MATAMEIAMAQAARKKELELAQQQQKGKVTKVQLVWRWIKDHPGSTNKAVAEAFGKTVAAAAGMTSYMYARDMLVITSEPVKGTPHPLHRFSVNPKMRGIYELLPPIRGVQAGKPTRKIKNRKLAPEQMAPAAAPAPAPEPQPVKVQMRDPVEAEVPPPRKLTMPLPHRLERGEKMTPEQIVSHLTFAETVDLFQYLCSMMRVQVPK